MSPRLQQLRKRLRNESLDALLLSHPANITYVTGYLSRDSYLIVSDKKSVYITDSRYTEEAKVSLGTSFRIRKIEGSPFKTIGKACLELGLRRIGFEERYLPYAEYREIKHNLGNDRRFIPTHSLIEGLREVKDGAELTKIRKTVAIAVSALKYSRKVISAGKTELEVAAEIERFIRYEGALGPAFSIIVSSGSNSGYPHHITSQRKIRNNEPVLIDMGVDYSGYKSDLTRVFFLGKINSLNKKVYQTVLRAQRKALDLIKPGVVIKTLDNAARQYIASLGYGGFFGHNLGHGVGLEVHEEPHLNGKDEGVLKKGMVFTVEPGIYLPGKFGVRIEDMVLVTEKGMEVLSGSLDK